MRRRRRPRKGRREGLSGGRRAAARRARRRLSGQLVQELARLAIAASAALELPAQRPAVAASPVRTTVHLPYEVIPLPERVFAFAVVVAIVVPVPVAVVLLAIVVWLREVRRRLLLGSRWLRVQDRAKQP